MPWGERKSGIPLPVETPAPPRKTMRRAFWIAALAKVRLSSMSFIINEKTLYRASILRKLPLQAFWVIQNVIQIRFFRPVPRHINILAHQAKTRFENHPFRSLVPHEMGAGEKIEIQLLKAKGNHPSDRFAHIALAPFRFCEDVTQFPTPQGIINPRQIAVIFFNSHASEHLIGFFLDESKSLLFADKKIKDAFAFLQILMMAPTRPFADVRDFRVGVKIQKIVLL